MSILVLCFVLLIVALLADAIGDFFATKFRAFKVWNLTRKTIRDMNDAIDKDRRLW